MKPFQVLIYTDKKVGPRTNTQRWIISYLKKGYFEILKTFHTGYRE